MFQRLAECGDWEKCKVSKSTEGVAAYVDRRKDLPHSFQVSFDGPVFFRQELGPGRLFPGHLLFDETKQRVPGRSEGRFVMVGAIIIIIIIIIIIPLLE